MTANPRLATLEQLVDSFSTRGDSVALSAFGPEEVETLGYGALHLEILRFAGALQQRGIGPGQMVVLWAPNSPAWVVAYFGILSCGATVIPLDNQTTIERAAAVAEHSDAALVVTAVVHAAALGKVSSGGVAYVLLDGDSSDTRHWKQLPDGSLRPPDADPERIASLLYTSGTTGTPKAVPLTHGNLAANVSALLDAKLLVADDVVLVPLPFHHVYPFTVGLLTVLATGARVVLPGGISGPEITRAASESAATALIAVPRLCTAIWEGIDRGVRGRGKRAQMLFGILLAISSGLRRYTGIALGRLLFRSLHDKVGSHLRTVGCGGAQLDRKLARRLEALGWTVLTGYGLTETSPVLTFNQHKRRKLGTEGIPLPGVELRCLRHPDYEHGEIIARGPNVFSGYWRNPEETRKAFTDDGWFKTGDLGWLDRRGYLHIAGRSKEVIVLPDGKNVFPDEIEEEFATSTLLDEIAVLEHDSRLHALVVPNDQAVRDRGAHRIEELLKEEIAEVSLRLPPYQRLSDYRITRTPLPRTPLGKLRRHLLADAYAEAATRKIEAQTATLSDEDRKLIDSAPVADVWAWFKARYSDRSLTLETSPQLDLNIDSLEWVTLTLELERQFNVSLNGDAVSRIVTIRDFLREVQSAPAPSADSRGEARVVQVQRQGPLLRLLGSLLLATNRGLLSTMFRIETVGLENLPPRDATFVIAPNHVSYLDPLAVAAALPRAYLENVFWAGWAGKMYSGPIITLISRATRVFPVEPDRDPSGALALGLSVLEQKRILVWFPEGRRSYDGELQRFQAGIGRLLIDGDAHAVPAAILGAFEAWPRNQRYPRRGHVTVVFGRPMNGPEMIAAGRGDNDAERIADALQSAVASLLAKMQNTR
jgi:long-chain acyl-CoA synthetase